MVVDGLPLAHPRRFSTRKKKRQLLILGSHSAATEFFFFFFFRRSQRTTSENKQERQTRQDMMMMITEPRGCRIRGGGGEKEVDGEHGVFILMGASVDGVVVQSGGG
jgi:hypothetical protein